MPFFSQAKWQSWAGLPSVRKQSFRPTCAQIDPSHVPFRHTLVTSWHGKPSVFCSAEGEVTDAEFNYPPPAIPTFSLSGHAAPLPSQY